MGRCTPNKQQRDGITVSLLLYSQTNLIPQYAQFLLIFSLKIDFQTQSLRI